MRRWPGLLMGAALTLGACASPAQPTPTLDAPRATAFIQTRVAVILTASAPTATFTPSPTPTPSVTPTPSITPSPAATRTPSATPSLTHTATRTPAPTIRVAAFPVPPPTFGGEPHLWLGRPLAEGNVFPASTYRYGSTFENQLRMHHGIDFGSPAGTPLIAVAGGVIYYAGSDSERAFGPRPNFYGNVVALELAQTYNGRRVFALYGHLSEVLVSAGQPVNAGDVVGRVGATGIAFGPHLHFEVRLDKPDDYYSAYNPELWLIPASGGGALAVRVTNANNRFLPGVRVNLACADGGRRFVDTYWEPAANPDPVYGENAALNDLPLGPCVATTTLFDQPITQTVNIRPNTVNFLWLKP